jgi:2-octaprenyl-6-methoxyphenol hydroxylase
MQRRIVREPRLPHLRTMAGELEGRFDVVVVGGGATGFAAAIAAAIAGARTAIFAPPAEFPPGRTAALLSGSTALLGDLDVWPALMRHAAPLRAIRMVDATKRLIRAPEVMFHASEIGLRCFGFNVPNADLVEALHRHAQAFERLAIVRRPVRGLDPGPSEVGVVADDLAVTTALVVAADGGRSRAREAAGIGARSWTHRQSALVAILAVGRPHNGVSTEFHTEGGPFTLVPLPGDRVSLVWVDRPERVEALCRLDLDAFAAAVEAQAHSILGAMRAESAPAAFPLRAVLADRFADKRVVLVGEAAHQFPPIGAQGLNLGFRDVAALRRLLSRYRDDPGAPAALAAYHRARQGDVRSRMLAVELLNRSLLTDFLPAQAVRGLAFAAAASVPVVRRALMRQGLGKHAPR